MNPNRFHPLWFFSNTRRQLDYFPCKFAINNLRFDYPTSPHGTQLIIINLEYFYLNSFWQQSHKMNSTIYSLWIRTKPTYPIVKTLSKPLIRGIWVTFEILKNTLVTIVLSLYMRAHIIFETFIPRIDTICFK